MRPAPPAGPAVDDPAPPAPQDQASPGAAGSGVGGWRGRSNAWRASRLLLGLGLLAALGAAVLAMRAEAPERDLVSNPRPTPSPAPMPAPPPPRAVFSFAEVRVNGVAALAGTGSPDATDRVADQVATRLTGLYDLAFLEPATWAGGLPDEAWEHFDPALVRRAQRDAASFSLGRTGPDVESLEPGRAELRVTVLLDGRGVPQAALASVEFDTEGTLRDDSSITVRNRATYLFRPRGGEWLIAGYPRADTKVKPVGGDGTGSGG